MSNINKIWGERFRIFLNDKIEVDLLKLKGNSFCSLHNHESKINRFILVSGNVRIDTELGSHTLIQGECYDVLPPYVHKFVVLEDSTMIEIAYVNNGTINANDINRISQGGLTINGVDYTIPELKEKGLLSL